MYTHTHTCSVYGPVQKVKGNIDPKQASIRLAWDPPIDFNSDGATYRIRFKPEGRSNYDEETVRTNYVSLTRNSGLKASNWHTFEVRAESTVATGKWDMFSAYIGKYNDVIAEHISMRL